MGGKFIILLGILTAIPLSVLPFYPDDAIYAPSFAIPAAVCIAIGCAACIFGKKSDDNALSRQSSIRNSHITVLSAWLLGIFAGAVPFIISGQLTVLQSLFESVSGWTTTGLSVMNVREVPHIFLFHRSFMQFCGGLGFVMMIVMLAPGKHAMNLFSAEGHPDKLMPSLRKTARTIFMMYSSFLVVGTAAYQIAGMGLFDSLNHAMCSLSTGGFSTKLGSIGEYDSLSIEIITIVLMLIGTTNFAVLLLLTKGKFRQVIRVSEVKFMLTILLIFVPVTAVSLATGLGMGAEESVRRGFLDIASALSTTGYSSMSYSEWPALAVGMLILAMLIGGGIGSTSGGLKMTRVYLLLRLAAANVRKRISPARNVEALHYIKAQGKTSIDQPLAADITGFSVCYICLFIVGSLLITVTAGCGLTEGMFEFSSALGTVGLSIGVTGPDTGSATLIVEMFGMLLGRLEIFIVLTGIYSAVMSAKKSLTKS